MRVGSKGKRAWRGIKVNRDNTEYMNMKEKETGVTVKMERSESSEGGEVTVSGQERCRQK